MMNAPIARWNIEQDVQSWPVRPSLLMNLESGTTQASLFAFLIPTSASARHLIELTRLIYCATARPR